MNRLIASFARNTVFANIVLLIILLAGTLAAFSMVREVFPQFSLDVILITVPYPGADPEEVEEGICRKIEEAIESVEGIKEYTTVSKENVGSAQIEVHEDYEVDDVLERVRSQIDSISNFPVDAEKPIIRELLLPSEVVILGMSGQMSERRLKEWTENIKDEIQALPEVSQLQIYGMREYEIAIEVSEERLREYGLTFAQVAAAVRQSNLNLAGGTIRTRGEEIRVRTMGRKYTGKELSSIVVLARPEGEIITLDRLARVRDGFAEDPIQLTLNGEKAALLIVYKTAEEDALVIAKAVREFVKKTQDEVPEGANIVILFEISDMLKDRINILVRNGFVGLALVFFILWVFLDVRLSFWAGMGMPISVAGALAILWGMGETINMVSLFGLIMVIGIVVDDAIVVGEAIFFHRKRGRAADQGRRRGRQGGRDAGDCGGHDDDRGLPAPGLRGRRPGQVHPHPAHCGHRLPRNLPGGMPRAPSGSFEPPARPKRRTHCPKPDCTPYQPVSPLDEPRPGVVRGEHLPSLPFKDPDLALRLPEYRHQPLLHHDWGDPGGAPEIHRLR